MTKGKWRSVVCFGMILCVGVIFFIIIQKRKQSASTVKRDASQNTEWQDLNPFDNTYEENNEVDYNEDTEDEISDDDYVAILSYVSKVI